MVFFKRKREKEVDELRRKVRRLRWSYLRLHNMRIFWSETSVPCKKCDEGSHGNSMPFLVTNRLDGNLVQIDNKFHDYSMSFIQVLFVFHAGTSHGFWTSSSHGISMAFAKKMMGFPSDLVSLSNQTAVKKI